MPSQEEQAVARINYLKTLIRKGPILRADAQALMRLKYGIQPRTVDSYLAAFATLKLTNSTWDANGFNEELTWIGGDDQ
jgi:hypothetical protein